MTAIAKPANVSISGREIELTFVALKVRLKIFSISLLILFTSCSSLLKDLIVFTELIDSDSFEESNPNQLEYFWKFYEVFFQFFLLDKLRGEK